MAGLALPDLGALTQAGDGILGALGDLSAALPGEPGSVTAGMSGPTATLNVSLSIDAGGLTGDLTGALESLTSAIPDAMPALDDLGAALAEVLGLLDPLKAALTDNGVTLDIGELAFKNAGDPAARVTELLSSLAGALPADGLEAVHTFVATLTAFEAAIPTDPAQVANFLGQGFLGVPSDLLAPAQAALNGLLGAITALLPAGAADALPGLVTGLVGELSALEVHVAAIVPGDAASYGPALAALGTLHANLEAFATTVASLATTLQAALGGIDLGPLLAPIEAALAAVPELQLPDTGVFLDIVMEPIRSISLAIDSVTPAQVAAALDGFVDAIEAEFTATGLAEVEAMVRAPFEQVGELIAGLHLEAIREAVQTALAGVTAGIVPATDALATVRSTLVEVLDGAAGAVAAIAPVAQEVREVLETVASAVQDAGGAISLDEFAAQAQAIVTELAAGIGDFMATATDAIESVKAVIGELGDVDLAAAGAVAVDAIGRITATLSELDVTPLPDVAVSALKGALNALLDSLSLDPIQETLSGAIDAIPFEALDAFNAGVEALAQLDPAGLLAPLVAPFDALTAQLAELNPAALLSPVIAELQTAAAALDGLDPVALLAPLDAPLQSLQGALDAISPATLVAPLQGPYAELMGLVDKLDVTPFLDDLDTLTPQLIEQAVSGLSGLGTSLESPASEEFVGALGTSTPLGDVFGLRPGDVLRPVQDLYEKITGLIDQVPAATLVAAFEQLRSGLAATLDALSPGRLHAHVHAHVKQVLASFDIGANAALLQDLLPAYGRLSLAVDVIDPAAAAGAQSEHAQLISLTASVDPEAVLGPARDALRALRQASLGLATSIDVSGMATHHAALDEKLSLLLPAFLREPVTIEAVRAHLDAENPKHLAAAINAVFDELLAKLVDFAAVFSEKMPAITASFGGNVENAAAGMLRGAFAAVYDPLRAQLQTLDPAGLAADLDAAVYAPIRTALDSLSIAGIAGDAALTAKLDAARDGLSGVLDGLLDVVDTVGATFDSALASFSAVSPQTLMAGLQTAYEPVATALASIDLGDLAVTLHEQFERIGDQVSVALQDVIDALHEMIAAIPGGIEGVHAEVDISLRA